MALFLLSLPLAVSICLFGWARLWGDVVPSPLPHGTHTAVVALQVLVVILVFFGSSRIGIAALTATYLVLAVGSAYYLTAKKAAQCGCWGARSSSLTWWIPVMNVCASLVAVSLFQWPDWARSIDGSPLSRGASLVAAACLSFTIGEIIPSAHRLVPALLTRSRRYMAWVRGFPDLATPMREGH
jgi:hypothetical protein